MKISFSATFNFVVSLILKHNKVFSYSYVEAVQKITTENLDLVLGLTDQNICFLILLRPR